MPDNEAVGGRIIGKEFRYTALRCRPFTIYRIRLPDGKLDNAAFSGHLAWPNPGDYLKL